MGLVIGWWKEELAEECCWTVVDLPDHRRPWQGASSPVGLAQATTRYGSICGPNKKLSVKSVIEFSATFSSA
jgi:hypothetical protein